ncbi:MAG: ATP-binding cassette domain-containing protein [Phycisphaerales bacterium]|nr:ATP-binding cassette domain-containing protein [Phycisphaerae bacterium]NNF42501.1 ATP-binding cassette domain-containing protein [Phycisphaerales bacterium]NNM25238.1 ATP-binding cassette domain-containing protein [Phycisphaerales bacterium]
MTGPATEIRIHDLHKSFGGEPVLGGVDLGISRGEIVTVVGGSGCGKTVLLEHMIGQMDPDRGRVEVADHSDPDAPLRDLAACSEEELDRIRIHWAVVFQRNALFSGSVYENIALWPAEIKRLADSRIRPIAIDALRAVGFDDPESLLDRDRDALSGGMAKRVAIARALAMDPTLVFYDEPTTGLDPGHASHIHDLIAATHDADRAGPCRTTIIVTHDKDLLRRLRPRIVMLHAGTVFFDGPFAKFEASTSPIVRPYFDLMPALQLRHPV